MIYKGVHLEDCGHSTVFTQELVLSYFRSTDSVCPQCGGALDLWNLLLSCWTGVGATFNLLAPRGGRVLLETRQIEIASIVTLELVELGVPADATIRGINLTRNSAPGEVGGTVFPALLFGNEIRQGNLPHVVTIYVVPQGESAPSSANFALYVQFVPHQPDLHRRLMVGALIAHGDGDAPRALIDAHTAVDQAIGDALAQRTGGLLSGKTRLRFPDKIAVIDSMRRESGLPTIPTRLRNGLFHLSRKRNQVAHPSTRAGLPAEKGTAELLVAAFLGMCLAESSFDLPVH